MKKTLDNKVNKKLFGFRKEECLNLDRGIFSLNCVVNNDLRQAKSKNAKKARGKKKFDVPLFEIVLSNVKTIFFLTNNQRLAIYKQSKISYFNTSNSAFGYQ